MAYTGDFLGNSGIKGVMSSKIRRGGYSECCLYGVDSTGKYKFRHMGTPEISRSTRIENKYGLYLIDGFVIGGRVQFKLLFNSEDELDRFLRIRGMGNKIKKEVSNGYNAGRRILGAKLNEKTGVYDSHRELYSNIVIERNIKELWNYDLVNSRKDVLQRNKEMFISMGSKSSMVVNPAYGKNLIVVSRNCNRNGIKFRVIDTSISKINKGFEISIEDLYERINDVVNANIIDNKTFEIASIEGVYRYNIDEIYKEYKTGKVMTSKMNKAKILGIEHKEYINERGELLKLNTESSIVTIPNEATIIKSKSIHLASHNKVLKLNNNIKRYSVNAIEAGYNRSIEIIINTDSKLTYNILKSLDSIYGEAKVRFDRDLEAYEYLMIKIREFNSYTSIECDNKVNKGKFNKLYEKIIDESLSSNYMGKIWSRDYDKTEIQIKIATNMIDKVNSDKDKFEYLGIYDDTINYINKKIGELRKGVS